MDVDTSVDYDRYLRVRGAGEHTDDPVFTCQWFIIT
jgi:hypothetical protein